MNYTGLYTSPTTMRELGIALSMCKQMLGDFTALTPIVIDGLGFDAEIAEIGISDGKVVIEIRKK